MIVIPILCLLPDLAIDQFDKGLTFPPAEFSVDLRLDHVELLLDLIYIVRKRRYVYSDTQAIQMLTMCEVAIKCPSYHIFGRMPFAAIKPFNSPVHPL